MSEARLMIEKGKTMHVAGEKPVHLRKVSLFISNSLKIAILGVVSFGTWHGLEIGDKLNKINTTQEIDEGIEGNTSSSPQGNIDNLINHHGAIGVRAMAGTLGSHLANSNTNKKYDFSNVSGGVTRQATTEQYKLPITVEEGDTISSLTVKLYNEKQYFHALALQMEGLETEPYYIEGDSTQPTIGVGYNVKMGILNIGKDGVEREMMEAGIDRETIDKLTNPDKNISSQGFISVEQALALLDVSYARFENSTKNAIGEKYDELPEHRKAALVWLDYNSNIHKRPKLIRAVRNGDVNQAMVEMGTWITVGGKRQESPKVPVIRHLYHSSSNMYEAVMNPSAVKRRASANLLAWQKKDEEPINTLGVEENDIINDNINNAVSLDNNSTINQNMDMENLPYQNQETLRKKLIEQRNNNNNNNNPTNERRYR